MKVIFVRHGQTGENVAHRHQPNFTPLSFEGRKQAVAAGEVLRQFHPSHIISSPLVRALQTAGLIATECELIPSIDHAAKELERPQSLTGHPHFSLKSLLFYKFWFLGLSQGGESYRDLRRRIALVRKHLESLPAESVVVIVSHTVFINLFLAHTNRDVAMWPWQAVVVFLRIVRLKNAAMIETSYTEGKWSRTNDLNLS